MKKPRAYRRTCERCGVDYTTQFRLQRFCTRQCSALRFVVPMADRFWSKVAKTDAGCWPWTGARGHHGYGRFQLPFKGGVRNAHRLAYELANGVTVPADRVVCHTCDNPPCCNPDHLFVGTQADNIRDMFAKGRQGRRTA